MKKTINVESTFNDMRIDRLIRNYLGKIPQALLEKSLSEILEDDFYDTLQNSWTDKTTCLSKCKSTCTVTHKSGSFDASANYREKVW